MVDDAPGPVGPAAGEPAAELTGDEPAGERGPRRLVVHPSDFGRRPTASWHPLGPDDDPVEVIVGYWQHLVVCVLRETYGPRVDDEVASRLAKANATYLKRQMSGEYPVRPQELLAWTIAFDDISLFPRPDRVRDLYPPGALPAADEGGDDDGSP